MKQPALFDTSVYKTDGGPFMVVYLQPDDGIHLVLEWISPCGTSWYGVLGKAKPMRFKKLARAQVVAGHLPPGRGEVRAIRN